MSGVIYDRRIAAKVKGKVYKLVGNPAMMYGLEMAMGKSPEADLEVAELTRMGRIRNVSDGQVMLSGLETKL